jgi:hypothetical protein
VAACEADGGYLLVSDVLGATLPLVDTHLQAMEVLRDPSHVRDYSIQEWQALLAHAHFELEHFKLWPTRIDAATWAERMRTPLESVAAIRRLQGGAACRGGASASLRGRRLVHCADRIVLGAQDALH